jgi:hypothetical protein
MMKLGAFVKIAIPSDKPESIIMTVARLESAFFAQTASKIEVKRNGNKIESSKILRVSHEIGITANSIEAMIAIRLL